MPSFKLPKGYSFSEPHSITVPDKGYGGADISQAFDANGTHYVACNAWGPGEPSFRFRAFKAVSPSKYVEVPLPFLSTGRGEQDVQWYDGKAWVISWTGSEFNFGIIPGFQPFPSILSLEARIKALEARTPGAVSLPNQFTLAPTPIIRPEWEGRTLSGGVLVDVPAVFGVPSSSAYLIRFVAQSAVPNVRVRAGSQAAPFFLTMNLTAANIQTHIQGWAPGPVMYVSAVGGQAQIWLQVLGYV